MMEYIVRVINESGKCVASIPCSSAYDTSYAVEAILGETLEPEWSITVKRLSPQAIGS